MKALIYMGNKTMEYKDVPDPIMNERDNVLVKITAVGICGSDVHGYLGMTGRRNEPMIMGHEMAGEVVDTLGSTDLKAGDQVVILGFVNCGECQFCLAGKTNFCQNITRNLGILSEDGAMCELIAINEAQLIKVPSGLDPRLGALAEPLAVAYAGAKKLGAPNPDAPILLIGAGTIGLLVLASLLYLGHKNVVVSDNNDRRLGLAKAMGAQDCLRPEQLPGDGRYAKVLDAVGIAQTHASGLENVQTGGSIVWVGNTVREVTLPIPSIVMREITIIGSYIFNRDEFYEAVQMIVSGKMALDMLIECTAPLSEGADVFRRLGIKREDIIKAMLVP